MNKEILTAQEALTKPSLLSTQSELVDYKRYPLWGRAVFFEKSHPFFLFFSSKFSCQNFSYLNNPIIKSLPKNLYSTHPKDLENDILLFLDQGFGDRFRGTSSLFKDKLAKSYVQQVLKVNKDRISKNDKGENLSRGLVGTFLLDLSFKLLVFEASLSKEDKDFTKEFIFLLEDNIRLDLIKKKLDVA